MLAQCGVLRLNMFIPPSAAWESPPSRWCFLFSIFPPLFAQTVGRPLFDASALKLHHGGRGLGCAGVGLADYCPAACRRQDSPIFPSLHFQTRGEGNSDTRGQGSKHFRTIPQRRCTAETGRRLERVRCWSAIGRSRLDGTSLVPIKSEGHLRTIPFLP